MAARTRTDLESLDQSDSLAAFRDEFFLPEGVIYLNGNSLGAMPLAAAERGKQVVEQEWAEGLIGSMNTAGWYKLPSTLGRKIAPIVGAIALFVMVLRRGLGAADLIPRGDPYLQESLHHHQ